MTLKQALGLVACASLSACVIEHDLGRSPGNGSGSGAGSGSAGYARIARVRWALTLGGPGLDYAAGIVNDSSGDVIADGSFANTVDFGDRAVTTSNWGAWISKRAASDGHALWTQTFGTDAGSEAVATGLAILPDDSMIATGWYIGSITIGTTTLPACPSTNGSYTFITKLDRDGNVLWARSLQLGGIDRIAVAADGQMAVIGGVVGTIQFPNGAISAQADNARALVALDATATPLWAFAAQMPASETPVSGSFSLDSLAMTSLDDIIVSGTLSRDLQLGPRLISPAAVDKDAQYVARFSIAGDHLWTRLIGDATHEYMSVGLSLQPNDSVAVFSSAVAAWVGTEYVPAVEIFQPSGASGWTSQVPVTTREFMEAGVALSNGSVLTSGHSGNGDSHPLDLGQGPLVGCNYLAEQDATGALVGAIAYGDSAASQCVTVNQLAAHTTSSVALAGIVSTNVDLGTGSLRYGGGDYDAVLAAFDLL